jgi:2-desacetyl-2-hydroxyethyl bacteriochlorophyllide A dehydrogenase
MMKALRLEEIGRVELVEVEVPAVRDNQLLVRTGATTICTSDLADIRENAFGVKLPAVIGHEGAGTVVKTGAAVTTFRVGDRVACHPVHPCGKCPTCRRGLRHLCTELEHFGLNLPGTFAEYFVVREDCARVIPDGIPFTTAALAEPICVCLEALEQARVKSGDRLLILGDGPFGVLMARLAQSRKLGRLTIAGQHDFRLAFAGTAEKVNVTKQSLTGDYDAVILAVASAEVVGQGLSRLVPRGRLVLFAAATQPVPVDLFHVHMKELEIVGACNDLNLFDRAMRLLPEAAPLVTHRFALEDFRQALKLASTGHDSAMKIAFEFTGATP